MTTAAQALFVSYTSLLGGAEGILLDDATALRGPVAPAKRIPPDDATAVARPVAPAGRMPPDDATAVAGPVALACPEGPLAERARAAGIAVHPLAARRVELRASPRDRVAAPLRLAAQAREVRAVVERVRPACVIAFGMRSLLSCTAALAATRGPPASTSRHRAPAPPRPPAPCTSALGPPAPPRPPALVFAHVDLLPSPLVGRLVRAAARRADLVVALSQAIADDLDPGRSLPTRVEVVRPGVDLRRFEPSPMGSRLPQDADPSRRGSEAPSGVRLAPRARAPTSPAARSPAGARLARPTAAPTSPVALSLGAIVGWKRLDLALEAVALAARELPGLRLRIAGAPLAASGDRLLAELRRRAAAPDLAGRVDFLGPVDDVPAALADATCLLHCADREPYGMALVEALACGRPVVAAAAAGPLEIVDATCGALYRPGDAGAAAAALVDAVHRAAELGPAARARAKARFDATASQARFAELIDGVAA